MMTAVTTEETLGDDVQGVRRRCTKTSAMLVALGFRAVRGGCAVVAVAVEDGTPRVVASSFLATATRDDRLALEPYRVAAAMRHVTGAERADAMSAVAEGRKRQDRLATDGLAALVGALRDAACEPVVAALLVNRAGWITDLLAYSWAAPEHPAVADGLAVREAVRCALGRVGMRFEELDEKSLPARASEALRMSPPDLDAQLKALGASVGPPWRKEQKLACLAAWVVQV
jgi:hypothetical protein